MKSQGSNTTEVRAMLADMAAEVQALKQAAGGSVTDAVAAWLPPQYLVAAREKLAALDGDGRLAVLRTFVQDWTLLRRGDHASARLQLDREKLELDRQKHRAAVAAAQPEIQKLRDPKLPMSDADRRAIIDKVDEIMGLPKGKY